MSRRRVINLKFLSPKDISKILNICYEDALSLVKYSGLPYVKIGRLYRVKYDEFERLLASGKINYR